MKENMADVTNPEGEPPELPTIDDLLAKEIPQQKDALSVIEVEPQNDAESQIRWLMVKMTRLESKTTSYSELQLDQDFAAVRGHVAAFTEDARNYFNSRIRVYEASRMIDLAGGDIDSFKELGKNAGLMKIADTMMSRWEVAHAYNGLEKRCRNSDPSQNPSFATPDQLRQIKEEIANEIVTRSLEKKGIKTNDVQYLKKKQAEQLLQVRAVQQAELFWRMWMRSALWNGLVFKDGTNSKLVEELTFLPPQEIAKRWSEYQQYVDWGKSFKSDTAEFAVKRLLWAGLFHEANQQGEQRMRPYLNYGSQDLVSNFLDSSFITASKNFKDGNAFVLDSNQTTLDEGKVFIKKNNAGEVIERVFIHKNGVFEIDHDLELGFDASKIKWGAKGETAYVGVFMYQRLSYADKIRDTVMNPTKLARDPYMKVLLELYASLENLDSVQKDIEKMSKDNPIWTPDKIAEELDKKRKEGKLYREDLFMMLGTGVLKFQMNDLEKKHKVPNLNWSQVDGAVDMLRTQAMLTEDQAKEMKKILMKLDGLDMPEYMQSLIRSAVIIYIRTEPGSILVAMLQEFLKQALSTK